jgi:PadR family transcriptional regulator, regulatory protein PadR
MTDSPSATQLRRGVVGPCILALLSSGPRYGLQLVTELNEVGELLTSQGTVYPLMNRLHETGLVTSYWETSDVERPRRYYEITDAGLSELRSFEAEWFKFTGSVSDLLRSVGRPPMQSAAVS